MKKIALFALVLLSFQNVFATSESTTNCDDINQQVHGVVDGGGTASGESSEGSGSGR